jgi:RNA polymerase sigma factor (sigma-70 family)
LQLDDDLPGTLSRLRNAADAAEVDVAWAEFVAAHSDTVLHTCRSVLRDHDSAMDGYAHALELLRADGCRRLRAYVPRASSSFRSWLVVVTRRLVLDYVRRRYGRSRSDENTRKDDQRARRRLENLLVDEIDPDRLIAYTVESPDAEIRRRQLTDALRDALATLAPEDRLLLALRFEDEQPVRSIAKTLGLPTVFHVYRRLGAALQAVRRTLAAAGVEEATP